jgi:hypothetical protein
MRSIYEVYHNGTILNEIHMSMLHSSIHICNKFSEAVFGDSFKTQKVMAKIKKGKMFQNHLQLTKQPRLQLVCDRVLLTGTQLFKTSVKCYKFPTCESW